MGAARTDTTIDNIAPIYETPHASERIFLAAEDVSISAAHGREDMHAEVYLRFLPRPRIIIEGVLGEDLFAALSRAFGDTKSVVTFPGRNTSCEITVDILTSGPPVHLVGLPLKESIVRKFDRPIRRVFFHIVNFSDFVGKFMTREHTSGRVERHAIMYLEAQGFRTALRSVSNSLSLHKELRGTGGYGITHFGSLEKEDGSDLSLQEAETWVDHLTWFLSFSRGSWSAPILPIGLAGDGSRVWEEWGVRRIQAWESPLTWFDKSESPALETFYPSFTSRMLDPRWTSPLKTAIYWYVQGNLKLSGMDGSIILRKLHLNC